MQRLRLKMADEDFKAPDWVTNNEEERPVTDKQKKVFTVVVLVALPFCLWAGWFEFGRAQTGNWRAWVYTFEWPFFGGVAIYLWRRIMRGDVPRIPRPDLSKFEPKDDGNQNK
jgi:hypothetical protein